MALEMKAILQVGSFGQETTKVGMRPVTWSAEHAHRTQYSKPLVRKTERSSAQWRGRKAEFHEGTELEAAS